MWEKVRLSELIEKPKSGEWGIEGEKIKVIRTTNFTNEGSIDFTNVVYRDISDEKIAEKKLYKGDIIIEKSGGSPSQPVGRVVFFNEEEDYLYNNFTSLLRPKKKRTVEKYIFWFLFYYYKSNKVLKFQNKTTGIINLKLNDYVDSINVPLPPLVIQQQIVAILDKADRLRQLDKAIEEKYDALAKSIFIDMFGDPVKNEKGWEVKKLKEITSYINSGNTPKGGRAVYVDNGIAFFRSQNVWKNKLVIEDIAYIDLDTHNKMKKSQLKNKDILMTKTGRINTENSSLGRAAIFYGEDNSANLNGHVYLIRIDNFNVVNEFILFILTTIEYRDYIRGVCVGGIDKRQLNKEHIEDFPIIIPPIALQNEFVQKIALINQMKEQEMKGEELFQALLQKAFKGELVS